LAVAWFVITLANPRQVLSECHRVVKPGGRMIVTAAS
jgi:phosphatidylethanolamine/phosphatidyl-N-methylethanolamine N-methyltransferase